MTTYRVRFTFRDGAWAAASARRSNEFATVPVSRVVRSKYGRYLYLPVLSAVEPEDGATPYRCVTSYLDALPLAEKCRRAEWMRLAAEVRQL